MQKYLVLFIGVLATACTMNSNPETGMGIEFDMPFQKKEWAKSEYEDTVNGRNFCVITTGRNGLKVILRKDAGAGPLSKAIKSTRDLLPGTTLRVAVNGNVYRTATEFFPASLTDKIIYDFQQADKAYLEWREPNSGRFGVLRYSTIVKLRQFAPLYDACVAEL